VLCFGIDPSYTCGWAQVELIRSKLRLVIAGVVESLPDDGDTEFRLRKVATAVRIEYARHCVAHIAIEVPKTRNAMIFYKRKDKTQGSRAMTSAEQWTLIGRLQEWAEGHKSGLIVTPEDAKQAVGCRAKAPKADVLEAVRRLVTGTGAELDRYGKAGHREAVADAIAVAVAGLHRV